jgi:hypothetical protein
METRLPLAQNQVQSRIRASTLWTNLQLFRAYCILTFFLWHRRKVQVQISQLSHRPLIVRARQRIRIMSSITARTRSEKVQKIEIAALEPHDHDSIGAATSLLIDAFSMEKDPYSWSRQDSLFHEQPQTFSLTKCSHSIERRSKMYCLSSRAWYFFKLFQSLGSLPVEVHFHRQSIGMHIAGSLIITMDIGLHNHDNFNSFSESSVFFDISVRPSPPFRMHTSFSPLLAFSLSLPFLFL